MLCIDSYMYVYITFIGFHHSLMDWCFCEWRFRHQIWAQKPRDQENSGNLKNDMASYILVKSISYVIY